MRANDVTSVTAVELADALSSPECGLRSLDLSGCAVGERGASALGKALAAGTPLETLLLNGAEMETTGLIALLSAIRDLSVEASTKAADAAVDLPSVPSVTTAGSAQGHDHAGSATDGLIHGGSRESGSDIGSHKLRLRRLELDSPRLFACTEDTTYHAARAIARNSTLQSISLEKQPCASATGAEVLATALEDHPSLTEVRFGCNRIGPDGVAAFARLSVANRRIRSYKLDCTHACNQGAAAWADVLVGGSGAERLDLRSAAVLDAGVLRILNAIGAAGTEEDVATGWRLRRVLLWGNEFGPKSCDLALRLYEAGVLVPVGDAARTGGGPAVAGDDRVAALVRVEVDVRPFYADGRAQVAHCE